MTDQAFRRDPDMVITSTPEVDPDQNVWDFLDSMGEGHHKARLERLLERCEDVLDQMDEWLLRAEEKVRSWAKR